MGKLRVLDLTKEEVHKALAAATGAASLFKWGTGEELLLRNLGQITVFATLAIGSIS
jgi:hypothetical protein